jgi:hypothetical protein
MIFQFLNEIRLAPLLKGNIKRIPLAKALLPKKTGGTDNARYCYSVWLRHLIRASHFRRNKIPNFILELGPGDSLGVGLAALLCGAEKYTGIDIIKFWNTGRNLQMLDDLVELFKSRTAVPGPDEFPNLFPGLEDYSFPSYMLSDELLTQTLSDNHIERLRNMINRPQQQAEQRIEFILPEAASQNIQENSFDLIMSQAVLGQIDDLETVYASMKKWIKNDGYISHTVDLSCHGYTRNWNGHWTLTDFEWKIVRGGRIFAINCQPLSKHRAFLEKNDFTIFQEMRKTRINRLNRNQIAERFKYLTEEDLETSGVFFIGQKKMQNKSAS